jgi:hypothetical protein
VAAWSFATSLAVTAAGCLRLPPLGKETLGARMKKMKMFSLRSFLYSALISTVSAAIVFTDATYQKKIVLNASLLWSREFIGSMITFVPTLVLAYVILVVSENMSKKNRAAFYAPDCAVIRDCGGLRVAHLLPPLPGRGGPRNQPREFSRSRGQPLIVFPS